MTADRSSPASSTMEARQGAHEGMLDGVSGGKALRLFVEQVPAAVAVLDHAFRYVAVSRRWALDFALAGPPAAGASHFDFFEDPEGAWRALCERCLDEEAARHEEMWMHRKDGSRYRVRWEVCPWRPGPGAAAGLIVVAHDRTERRRIEAERIRQANDLAIFTERLKQLHRLSTSTYDSLEDLLEDYLRTGRDIFGMEVGVISQVDGERCVFRVAYPDTVPGFQAGRSYALSEMYCQTVLAGGETMTYADARAVEALRVHPAYVKLHVHSYLGTPVLVNGIPFGVLFFASRKPRAPFDAQEREVVELMAEGIGRFIGLDLAEAARQRAQLELVKEREFLHAVLNNIQEGTVACDENGVLTLFNRAARLFHGLPEQPVPSDQWAEYYGLHHADGTPMATAEVPLFRAFQGEQVHGVEMQIRPKDGKARTLVASGQPLLDAEGNKLGAVVAMHDISERVEAEARLRESEYQLRRAQEIAHLGYWAWNVQTGALHWSDELYRIYGLTSDAPITYERYLALVHPEDRGLAQGVVEEAFRTHEPFQFYHRIIRPDGEERILHGEGEVFVDDGGNVVKMFGTGHDVTEVKRAEEVLRLLEASVSASLDGITISDAGAPDHPLIYVSPGFERITGYTAEEILGRNCRFLQNDDRDQPALAEIRAAIREGRQCRVVLRNYRQDGTLFWNELTLYPLHDAGRLTHYVGIQRDVTERRQAEQALARINAKLEQRNRELQDFAYVASHDLQEPLRKIRAFADLMEEDYGDAVEEMGRYYLERMQDAATRMSHLISDLLVYSRVATHTRPFDRVDLGALAADVLSDLEVQISEAEGSVDVGLLPTLEADTTQMRQLLQNLIANALKFRRPGVRPVVTVCATVEESTAPGGEESRPVCRLEVRDNGIGFDEKYLDRIFTPFQRLHHRGEYAGTGMGLAICRRIVERHHGTLTARSTPGQGTAFILTLPLRQPNPQPKDEPA